MDIVQELEESAEGWDDCGSAFASNADMERRAAMEITQLRGEVKALRVALGAIVAWDMPPTGNFHENGDPMSYSYCYGSNGERDYIRNIATQALAKPQEGE